MRSDTLQVTGGGPFLIRPFLIQGSVSIERNDSAVDRLLYDIDYRNGFVTFHDADPDSAFSFIARYQHIPLDVEDRYALWPAARVEEAPSAMRTLPPRARSNLVTTGSITRGVLAGSNRDASIESGLRLQVQGEIAPGVQVRAALTDENTPILPEGTTRRLDQFDRVFIEFESRYGRANLGDVETKLPGTRFASLDRKLQGVSVSSNWLTHPAFVSGSSFQLALATSKGLFRSQEVEILEGVLGPYRLEGARGERFILILPGSEKIYLDGQLLSRGDRGDYTIDYTTGELTFTQTLIMGSDKRVRAEFEYSTNQFTRTFAMAETRLGLGRLNGKSAVEIGIRAIREADGDQFSDEFGISAEDSVLIASSGDKSAFASGARVVEYNAEAFFTQYIRVERTVPGSTIPQLIFEVLDREPLPDEIVYRVSFSFVGSAKGSYERGAGLFNGIVYGFVGLGVGDYDPIRPLPTPLKQELFDLHVKTVSIAGLVFEGEWAVSNLDKNRLSGLDSGDDAGNAYGFSITSEAIEVLPSLSVSVRTDLSKRNASFTTFERARPVEFEREWNLGISAPVQTSALISGASERVRSLELELQKSDSSYIRLAREDLELGSIISADRSRIEFLLSENGFPLTSFRSSFVNNRDVRLSGASRWAHHSARFSRRLDRKAVQPFVEWEEERSSGERSLTRERAEYDEYRAGVSISNGGVNSNVFYERRIDKATDLESASVTNTASLGMEMNLRSTIRNTFTIGFRQLRKKDSPGSVAGKDALLIGLNGNANLSPFDRLQWFYRTQSERSATLQEIFVRTGQERGQFVWLDLNNDDVIQLEEFIPETTPGEGEYVRTFFPTDSLVAVTTLSVTARYERRPNRNGSWIERLGLRTSFEIEEKSRDDRRANLYLMRLSSFRSAGNTISGRLRISQSISLFPLDRERDVDLEFRRVETMTDLASGVQTGVNQEMSVRIRRAVGERLNVNGSISSSIEESKSASFSTRNFDIASRGISPGISYRLRDPLLLSVSAHLFGKKDRESSTEATLLRFPVEWQYSSTSKLLIRLGAEFSSIDLRGQSLGLQAFEMTDGRGAGDSWLWNLSLNARLTEIVTATLGYDGRSPETGDVIHTGRVQLSARF